MTGVWWTLLGILAVGGLYLYMVLTAVQDPEDGPERSRSQDDDKH